MEENRDFSKDRDGDESKDVADVEDGVDQEIERVRLESFENVKRPKRRRVRMPKKTVAKTPKKIEQKEDIRESAGEIVPVAKEEKREETVYENADEARDETAESDEEKVAERGDGVRDRSIVKLFSVTVATVSLVCALIIMGAVMGRDDGGENIETLLYAETEESAEESETVKQDNKEMPTVLSSTEIYSNNIDGVVSVSVVRKDGSGIGSGFFISEDGYIATAAHVIDGAERIRVIENSGDEHEARVIGSDSFTDVALIKVEGEDFPALRFGDSGGLQVGERVIAIGTPASLEYAGSLTSGEVSFNDRVVKIYEGGELVKKMTLIQMNNQVNPGNSGCPLFNEMGDVIGMVTMKLGQDYSGIGFALPSDGVEKVIDVMKKGEELSWEDRADIASPIAKIGISADEYSEGDIEGLRIVEFNNSECSAARMLKVGDIITSLNGYKVSNADEWITRINDFRPGDSVSVTVYRSGQYLTFLVILY